MQRSEWISFPIATETLKCPTIHQLTKWYNAFQSFYKIEQSVHVMIHNWNYPATLLHRAHFYPHQLSGTHTMGQLCLCSDLLISITLIYKVHISTMFIRNTMYNKMCWKIAASIERKLKKSGRNATEREMRELHGTSSVWFGSEESLVFCKKEVTQI